MRAMAGLVVVGLLCGCATRPLPEDTTGLTTPQIVKQIRCETREAVRQELIRWLGLLDSEQAKEMSVRFSEKFDAVGQFHYDQLNDKSLIHVRNVARVFFEAAVVYKFELTMTENNNLSVADEFKRPNWRPSLSLPLTGSADFQRLNERSFTISDSFNSLLKLPQKYCEGKISENQFMYPISGKIGADKMVKDFIQLALFHNLDSQGSTGKSLVDRLYFKTKLDASINPIWIFEPIGRMFQATKIGIKFDNSREDQHQVIMSLAVVDDDALKISRGYLFSRERLDGVVGKRVASRRQNVAKDIAQEAIEQVDSKLLRLRVVQ